MHTQALIGCGSGGTRYIEQLGSDVSIVAVCDLDVAKASKVATQLGCSSFPSIDALLQGSKFETLVICTPTGFHAEHSIKALQAGKDVLCDWPLCLTSAAAWQITETEKYCNRKIAIIGNQSADKYKDQLPHYSDNTDRPNTTFRLDCSFTVPDDPSSWRLLQFPGGGHLYSSCYPAIELLTLSFGAITNARTTLKKDADPASERVENGGASICIFQDGQSVTLNWEGNKLRNSCFIKVDDDAGEPVEIDLTNTISITSLQQANTNTGSLLTRCLTEARLIVENIEKIYAAAQTKSGVS